MTIHRRNLLCLPLITSALVACNAPGPRGVSSTSAEAQSCGQPLAGPPPTTEGSETPPFDADRDLVLRVEKLGCSLVCGVGCGHLLAPLLAEIDAIPGARRAMTNWTGAFIRITVATPADRDAVAGQARARLTQHEHESTRLPGAEAARVINAERWWPAAEVRQLTSHEFRTHMQRTLADFARRENLDGPTAARLSQIGQEQWDAVARSSGRPPLDAEGYPAYWDARLKRLSEGVLAAAQSHLTPAQLDRLRRETPCDS